MSDVAETPTHCKECGQVLLLRKPGRDVCARCSLGRTGTGTGEAIVIETRTARPSAVPIACSGCGRDVLEDGTTPVPIADGYCLACRLDGAHLNSVTGARAPTA